MYKERVIFILDQLKYINFIQKFSNEVIYRASLFHTYKLF